MAGTKYKLAEQILIRLHKAGLSPHFVLIGSWAVYYYRYYFKNRNYLPSIRTRDMDFLVSVPPPRVPIPVNMTGILSDLGFVTGFRGEQGYMVLQHSELMIEFLVPERGRGWSKPFELPDFGVNAQPLRYLDMLLKDTVAVRVCGINLRLPHPARFALHKLIIAGRRRSMAKAEKDRNEARKVLTALKTSGEWHTVADCLVSLPSKWRRTIAKQTAKDDLMEIVELIDKQPGVEK